MSNSSKNLHYEKQEPAFLRRLRNQHSGADGRDNVQIARPKKDRLKTADEDDAPVVVDEQGDVVGPEEYERLVKGGKKGGGLGGEGVKGEGVIEAPEVEAGVGEVENEEEIQAAREVVEPEKQKVAEVGGPRKRKAVRVVGNDVEDTEVVKDTAKPLDDTRDSSTKVGISAAPKTGTTAKKTKKVKLSFDAES